MDPSDSKRSDGVCCLALESRLGEVETRQDGVVPQADLEIGPKLALVCRRAAGGVLKTMMCPGFFCTCSPGPERAPVLGSGSI